MTSKSNNYTLTLTYDWDADVQEFKCIPGGKGYRPVAGNSLEPSYKGFTEGDTAHIRVKRVGKTPTGSPEAVTFVFSYEDAGDEGKFENNPFGAASNRARYGLSKVDDKDVWQPLMDGGVTMGEHLKAGSDAKRAKWNFHVELEVSTQTEERTFVWDPELIVDPYLSGGGGGGG